MMDGQQLKDEVLAELRKGAVARVESGERPAVVVCAMGFCRACIYNLLMIYRVGRWDALHASNRKGRPRKLNKSMIRWVYRVERSGIFTFAGMKFKALGALHH